ncbi:MAG: hypothetical protein H7Y41_04440 [Hyphomonadaceae bacterium]|nr:hypothetical protein [Clostridia bacterium]
MGFKIWRWMAEKNKQLSVIDRIILAVYVCISISALFMHEPWRDEAQAWLMARDMSIGELIANARYEGHPILWHLLLKILILFRCPYQSMFVLHMLINAIAVYLLFRFAPIARGYKLLIIGSYFISYEYNVIARNYVLVMLFLFLFAWQFPKRFEHPIRTMLLLSLLSLSHVYGMLFSGVMLAFYVGEGFATKQLNFKRWSFYFAMLLMTSTYLFMIWLLLPPSDISSQTNQMTQTFLADIASNLLPYYESVWKNIFVVICLVGLSLSQIRNRVRLFEMVAMIGAVVAFFFFRYGGGVQHVGTIWLAIIYAWWCSNEQTQYNQAKLFPIPNIIIHIGQVTTIAFLVASVASAVLFWHLERTAHFSNASDAAHYINRLPLELKPSMIISTKLPHGSALLPFLKHQNQLYAVQYGYFSFVKWSDKQFNADCLSSDPAAYMNALQNELQNHANEKNIFILVDKNESPEDDTALTESIPLYERFEQSAHFQKAYDSKQISLRGGEDFAIYKWQP